MIVHNDQFRGAGPDLGVHEVGTDPPVYGPRAALPGLSVGDATVVEGDNGALSLEFTDSLED